MRAVRGKVRRHTYLQGRLYAPSVAWLPSETLASSACQVGFDVVALVSLANASSAARSVRVTCVT